MKKSRKSVEAISNAIEERKNRRMNELNESNSYIQYNEKRQYDRRTYHETRSVCQTEHKKKYNVFTM